MPNETRSRMIESGARLRTLITGRNAPWGRRLALIIAFAMVYAAGFNGLGTETGQWGVLPLTLLALGLVVGAFLLLKATSYLVRVLGLALGIGITLIVEHNWGAITESWKDIRPLSLTLTIGAVIIGLLFVWWLLPSRSASTRRRPAQPSTPSSPAAPAPRPRAVQPDPYDGTSDTTASFPAPVPPRNFQYRPVQPPASDPWSDPSSPSTPPRP